VRIMPRRQVLKIKKAGLFGGRLFLGDAPN